MSGSQTEWSPARLYVALGDGVVRRQGMTYRGLGLFRLSDLLPESPLPPCWSLTHLRTGHHLMTIDGDEATARRIGAEVADAGDWSFDGLYGWRDAFPNAGAVLRAIAKREPAVKRGGAGHSEAVAAAVAARLT